MGTSDGRTRGCRQRGSTSSRVVASAVVLGILAAPLPSAATSLAAPVLLTATDAAALPTLAASVAALGGRVLASLPVADSLYVALPKGAAVPTGATLVADAPMALTSTTGASDGAVATHLATVGADRVDVDCSGVTVALVDTGVAAHPSLPNVEHLNVSDAPDGDGFGHGTFLAGLIAAVGEYPGIAPGATILDVKVADGDGTTSLSSVLKGLQGVADRGDVDVLNLSLSSGSPLPPNVDPLTIALAELRESGVTVIASSGNDGPHRGSVASPGTDPGLLTVGATDERGTPDPDDDVLAPFSSWGTKYATDKPDIVAPGKSLISTAAAGSTAVSENPGSLVGTEHMRGSGTSMSAALVSGAAALVVATNPTLAPDDVKSLLVATAHTSPTLGRGAGAGELDVAAAVAAARSATPGASAGPAPDEHARGWAPLEDDAAAWAAFAAAWEAGDLEATTRAWNELSAQTQTWAARMFAMAVVAGSANDPYFDARGWAARGWAARGWAARGWASDEWLARGWAARGWAARGWADEDWAARGWAEADWAARGWADYMWQARGWATIGWTQSVWTWQVR